MLFIVSLSTVPPAVGTFDVLYVRFDASCLSEKRLLVGFLRGEL